MNKKQRTEADIIIKVNSALPLCDQLETHLTQSQQTQLKLTDILMAEALN